MVPIHLLYDWFNGKVKNQIIIFGFVQKLPNFGFGKVGNLENFCTKTQCIVQCVGNSAKICTRIVRLDL